MLHRHSMTLVVIRFWLARRNPFSVVWLMLTVVCVGLCGEFPEARVTGMQEASKASGNAEDVGLPLPVDRMVPIDLTEGSWISLDVSPDGGTLVFDYLGDLFTLPMAGGNATQFTTGLAFDAQPRFSPDGERILFTSDRNGGQNIWIQPLSGGEPVQVSEGATNRAESPEWMPDGDYVVASMGSFRLRGLPKLKFFHVDGGTGIDLVSEPENLKTLGPAPTPDGRLIWYARRQGDWTYNAQLPQYQLETYDLETGETEARSSRYGSAMRPTLSPDGRWLVYGTRHDAETGLVLRDLESGDERWLAYPVQRDDQESRATLDLLPGMSFTPDSRYLVTSYGGKFWKLEIEGTGVEEIPFRVQFDLAVGPRVEFDFPIEDTPMFTVRQIRDAVPSPDGTRLAFTALDRLWVADVDGSQPRRLTETAMSEHFPSWSPDGNWVVYSTWDGTEGHLYRVSANGGVPIRLTAAPAVYFSPVWGPENRIVAIRGFRRAYETQGQEGGPATELVWLSADPAADGGGPVTVIGLTDGRDAPHFVNGSDRIHLFRRPDSLVSIRWDGTDERIHLTVRGATPPGAEEGLPPSTIRMAPVGDQAFVELRRHIYVLTVPRIGVTPTVSLADADNAVVPARRLTDIGGEFPTWEADGRAVHWSLGNAHFVYDLDAAAEQGGGDEDPYRAPEYRVEISAARDLPGGVTVLRGARVISMRADEVIEDADVVVRGHRIMAVGPRGVVEIPDAAVVLDIAGRTVIPGFVDTHAHLRARDQLHRTDVWPYLANLAYGVTTTRDPQTGNTEVLSYADMVRTGAVLGPRVYSTGPGLFWEDGIDTAEEARDNLSRYADYYDTKTIKMYVSATRQGRQHIIMAARELGLMPTTEGALNFKQNLTETLDGYPGLEHSLPIFPLYGDLVRLFAETARAYTPTLLVSYGGPWAENYFYSRENPHDDAKLRRFVPHDEIDARTLRRGQWFRADQHVFARHAEFVKDLVEAGGRAGVGSHGQIQGIGFHWELWAMASAGLGEHDALRMATILGAEAIGLDGDIGSIDQGKLADLVILRRNPLEDLRHTNTIESIMLNGRLYDGDTLDEIHPRQQTLAPLWWWDDEPEGVPGLTR